MSQINITITQTGLRKDTVQKKVAELMAQLAPKATFTVSLHVPATSRAGRFQQAKDLAEQAKSAFEDLRDECQEWFDNLPEGFQDGDKGQQLQEAIDNLDQAVSSSEEVCDVEVEFPGMYS